MAVQAVLALVLLLPHSLKLPLLLQLLQVSDGEGVEYAIIVVLGDIMILSCFQCSAKTQGCPRDSWDKVDPVAISRATGGKGG